MQDCIFCRIVAGEIPASKVYESDDVLAFDDVNPAAPVHVLIVPKRHIETLNEASPPDAELLGKLLLCAKIVAGKKNLSETGYRAVINTMSGAGQVVFHVHMHVLGGRDLGWPPG